MDLADVARLRLRSQRLSETELKSAEAVVGWLGCAQSQDFAPGKWSVGQRAVGLSDAGLDTALADGRILRTHILRPTWHFVLPADIRWIQALTAPRVNVQNRHYVARMGLSEAVLRRSAHVLTTALEGRRQTRPQLQAALAADGIVVHGPALAYVLMQAELDCLITSGGLAGKQQTYALLDEIAPDRGADLSGDEALAEFTRRYFASHGPATVADYTWWSSLTVAEAKRGLDMVGSQLERATVDGLDHWAATFDLPGGHAQPRAHFIQGLDEYFVGYRKTRSAADVAGLGAAGILNFNGGFYHALVIDGQLAGAVRRVAEKSGVTFETRLFRLLATAERDSVQDAANRYAAFLDAPVRVTMVD